MSKRKSPASSKNEAISSGSVDTSILDAFARLQYQKGVSKVVLQDLAKEVGVAFGTVRYHFNQAGREVAQEALVHVMKKAYVFYDDQLFKARSQEHFNPVRAYVKIMFDWARKFPEDGSVLVYYYYLCTTQVTVSIPNIIFLEKARLRIEALIHEAVGRGLYSPPSNVAHVALQIHMTVLGGCLVAGTQRSDEQYDLQSELCLAVIERILNPN